MLLSAYTNRYMQAEYEENMTDRLGDFAPSLSMSIICIPKWS